MIVLKKESIISAKAGEFIIKSVQHNHFSDIFNYFKNNKIKLSYENYKLFYKLNLFVDDSRILRVKSKFDRNYLHKIDYPVILPKDDHFTTLLLHEYHIKLAHSGCYTILSEVRKKFFVEHIYSYIKKIFKSCIVCKRMNSRPIKVNQNAYREYRVNPLIYLFKICF